jgi:hypothetical protein
MSQHIDLIYLLYTLNMSLPLALLLYTYTLNKADKDIYGGSILLCLTVSPHSYPTTRLPVRDHFCIPKLHTVKGTVAMGKNESFDGRSFVESR